MTRRAPCQALSLWPSSTGMASMSDPRAGSRKGMRDGFSTPGECPEGMWERELGRLVGGGPELRNVGEHRTNLREMGWRRETSRLERPLVWRVRAKHPKCSGFSDIILNLIPHVIPQCLHPVNSSPQTGDSPRNVDTHTHRERNKGT